MRPPVAPWWKHGVFYEIYIRSFQDSNGDGIGDLEGIASRLDYLQDLGVDALWITPFYPSPQVDFGYDVTDHEDVDPAFGTLGDFDRLIDDAHRRGLKVVIDIILNHTSDRHPWFVASRQSRSSPYRDWYIWRDGAPGGGPPNNWESAFGGPAWSFDSATGQWYYHFFYPEQPDLNWRNPDVERHMLATLEFWLKRGVDGFRLDAVNTLYEDPDLRPNPPLPAPRVTLTGVYTQEFVHTRRLPEVHDALKRVRRFVDERAPDAVLISEAYLDDVADLVRFYGDGDEMHLPFNFFLAQVPSLDAAAFRDAIAAVEGACGDRWPTLALSNHDVQRAATRYGGRPPEPPPLKRRWSRAGHYDAGGARQGDTAAGTDRDGVARLLGMLLLTLRGTPFVYYGEELGLRQHEPSRLEEVRDPVGRRFWPEYKGRDGARRPMPWDPSPGTGFTTATPWLAAAPDAAQRSVARQAEARGSVLAFYRRLLRLRRTSPALRDGRQVIVGSHPHVLAYARRSADQELLVVLNMSDEPCMADLAGGSRGGATWHVALGSHREPEGSVDAAGVRLAPFESLLLERR